MQWRRVLIGTAAITLGLASGCGGDEPGLDEPGTTGQPFEWESVDVDFQLESVVALGDGFVGQAVEAKPGVQPEDEPPELPFTTIVVTSPDGITWSQADVPELGSDEMVQWRDGGPFGAVATVVDPAGQSPVPELLFTADGVEWVRGQLPPDVLGPDLMGFGPDSYAVGAAGVMAAFNVEGAQGPQVEVLLSEDLQEWQSLEHPATTSAEGGLVVAASPEEYLVSETVGGPGAAPLVGYVSPDGQSWEPVTSTEEYEIAGAGADWATGWREGFALSAEMYAGDPAAPEGGQGQSQIWLSAEDGTWAEVDMSALSGDMVGIRDGSSLGLLASGETRPEPGEPQDAYLMFSDDGSSWETFSARDTFAGEVGIAVMGERSLLVGSFDPEAGEAGAQWWLGTPAEE
jgi:hypothetical protein